MATLTYCGKDCTACAKKEEVNCPGCRIGPGRNIDGECELAKCCRKRGHNSCQTCITKPHCGLFQGRANALEIRQRRKAQEEARKREIADRSDVMAKWYNILFWLFLPGLIGSVLSAEFISGTIPFLRIAGQVLQQGSNLLYCIILLQMAKMEELYKKAGIFMLIGAGISILLTVIGESTVGLPLLLTIPIDTLAILAAYNEFKAHEIFFEEVDGDICDSWVLLRKLYIAVLCLTIGGALLTLFVGGLGLILLIIGVILAVIMGILRQILLYRSAKKAAYFALSVYIGR